MGPPGLNAFIPMLALCLLDRFAPLVDLPLAWAWLSSDVALWVVGILLVLEVVADKIPAVDAVNDVVQTVVRPAAGGITFASGVGAETVTVQDPDTLLDFQVWVPILIGAAMALLVHLTKAGTRAAANTVTMGTAAPVLSTAEDASALALTATALFLPVLVLVVLLAVLAGLWAVPRRFRAGRRGGRGASMAA
ncbi:DUF4126 domain-containing protein [Micrococcus porci]|uniref:DUF4126 domain-containing protein n=1 Tax=Micrococcus porci TaxID=2856555 RepID=UPI003CE7B1E6